MANPSSAFELRPMKTDEWGAVAELIHESTNSWYIASGEKPDLYRADFRRPPFLRGLRGPRPGLLPLGGLPGKAERLPGPVFIIPARLTSRLGS